MSGELDSLDKILQGARELRAFTGDAPEFWGRYLDLLATAASAETAAIFRLYEENGRSEWKILLSLPPGDSFPKDLAPQLSGFLPTVSAEGWATKSIEAEPGDGSLYLLGVTLSVGGGSQTVAGFVLPGIDEEGAARRALRVRAVADVAVDFQRGLSVAAAHSETSAYRGALESVAAIYRHDHFVAACMTLCNELAVRFKCQQVALGTYENAEYIRLKALSQMARFDAKASLVRNLEVAMEEAVDQAEEVLWPIVGGSYVARAHEQYARERGNLYLCTIPVKNAGKIIAAVTCERIDRPFSESELRQVSLICDLSAGRLLALEDRDRWLPLRILHSARRALASFVGTERTWVKVAGLTGVLVLGVLFLFRVNYRAEASFILKASQMCYLSAPSDGTVAEVNASLGDNVTESQPLIVLDRKALLLQQVASTADLQRYQREAEKNQAEDKLADMRINEALAEQARARLDMVNYQLERSIIRAPFGGVLVEGDWTDKVNSPVRRGEVLLKVAQLNGMYVELKIDSSHIARMREGIRGEIAFLSDPRTKYPIRVTTIHPAAVPGDKQPVFMARAELLGDIKEWWRPGMSGVVRLDVGRRSLWWIFTHRTTDFLRREMWW